MDQFEQYCKKIEFEAEVSVFKNPTRTAEEAAVALKCEVNQIGKSIVFNNLTTGKPLLIIVAGGLTVDEKKIEEVKGWKIEKMSATDVEKKTGYVIGGVAPFGHKEKIQSLIDQTLYNYQFVYASAGNVNAVFKVRVGKLAQLAEAEIIDLR
ncbi:MAG: YbaK/EbsC family protein [Candidatus Shapirobacteria bacterium]